jgi:hypothetical protein
MLQEPELLAEERQQVERNMQSSALSHYHAFIDSANCMSVVQQQLARACDGLDELSREVPDLATSFEAFSKDAAAVMAQRNSNKQLLGEATEAVIEALHGSCTTKGSFAVQCT